MWFEIGRQVNSHAPEHHSRGEEVDARRACSINSRIVYLLMFYCCAGISPFVLMLFLSILAPSQAYVASILLRVPGRWFSIRGYLIVLSYTVALSRSLWLVKFFSGSVRVACLSATRAHAKSVQSAAFSI